MWHGVQQATMVGWTMAKMRGMRWCWLAMLAVGQPVSAQRALPSVGGLANDVTQTVP
ncbi:peptidase S8, partial [Xanthomonas oryzae pv. oryzae]